MVSIYKIKISKKKSKKVLTFIENKSILYFVVRQESLRDTRDHSSAGRASALQAEGHRFEPYWSHFARKFFKVENIEREM